MISLPPAVKLWYCRDAVDMRLGFDGLFNLVRSRLNADPLSGHLFIFRNRTGDRLKVLYWGGHGLCLWCQRLEAGRYHFPDAPAVVAAPAGRLRAAAAAAGRARWHRAAGSTPGLPGSARCSGGTAAGSQCAQA